MTVIIDSTAVINAIRLAEQAGDPAAPAATYWLLYAKAAGLFIEDSAAVVTGPFGTGGGSSNVVTLSLQNSSGGTLNQGDVVIIDFSGASPVVLPDGTADDTRQLLGVVYDTTIADTAFGLVAFYGYVPKIALDASAALGDKLTESATPGQATPLGMSLQYDQGEFGQAMDTGTTPPAFLWGGLPLQPVERILVRRTSVNLNTGTATSLYTVPTGRSCIVTHIVIRNASTSLTTVAFSIGFNSASYNDVVSNATHTELTGSTLYTILDAKVGATRGAAADILKLLCNTLQGGAATCTVEVMGFLF